MLPAQMFHRLLDRISRIFFEQDIERWQKRQGATTDRRIGVIMVGLNEVACAAFAIGPWLPHVDLFVFVDTGSEDGTLELLQALFADEIRSGKLIVEQIGRLPDYELAIAKNHGLRILREQEIDYFIRLDADEVFYDSGAQRMVQYACQIDFPNYVYCGFVHLYQYQATTTAEWLAALHDKRDIFSVADYPPKWRLTTIIYPVEGAVAAGKWTDEVAGRPAEGYRYARHGRTRGTEQTLCVHYSLAKPVDAKRIKSKIMFGDPHTDPTVNRLHAMTNPPVGLAGKFTDHPEIIAQLLPSVRDWHIAHSSESQ